MTHEYGPMSYVSVDQAMRAEEATALVSRLCGRALAEIAEGWRDLAAVRHPLGFLCLPVSREGAYGVCVHVWAAELTGGQTTTSTVHAHSWDLVSFVLYGRVDNRVVRVVEDDAAGTHRVFEIHSRGDLDEIRATPRLVRWVEEDRQVMGPGDIYRLAAGQFHTTHLDRGTEAATVVLGQTRATVDQSLGRIETSSHRVARQRCGPAETAQAAYLVLDRLAAGTGPDRRARHRQPHRREPHHDKADRDNAIQNKASHERAG